MQSVALDTLASAGAAVYRQAEGLGYFPIRHRRFQWHIEFMARTADALLLACKDSKELLGSE